MQPPQMMSAHFAASHYIYIVEFLPFIAWINPLKHYKKQMVHNNMIETVVNHLKCGFDHMSVADYISRFSSG